MLVCPISRCIESPVVQAENSAKPGLGQGRDGQGTASSSRRKPGSRGNRRSSQPLWIPAFAGMTGSVVFEQDACALLAATRIARPGSMRGWRAEKRKSYGSCSRHRGRLAARQSADVSAHRAPLYRPGPSTRETRRPSLSASSWQGLVVDPGGAPRRPRAAVRHDPQGHRTSSRLTTPHDAPLKKDEVDTEYARFGQRGLCGESAPRSSSRRKPGSRGTRTEPAALDTGFRRYDGVRFFVQETTASLLTLRRRLLHTSPLWGGPASLLRRWGGG